MTNGTTSSVAVTQACLQNIERLNPADNAMAGFRDDAREFGAPLCTGLSSADD